MAKSRNFKEYDDLGVRFIYPTNWIVQTETWDKGTYGISVDSPEGSFWSVAIFPKDADLDEAAKNILSQLHAEYDEIEENEIERVVADCVLDGYEINFFYLDLTSTAQALKFEDGERGYVVFWQTCDRLAITGESLSRVDVFDVMTHTLVCNLTGQADFVEDRSGGGSKRGKDDPSVAARAVAQSDERLEDFLRDDDEDEIRESLVNDGFERAGYDEEEYDDERDYDEEDSEFDSYEDDYDRDEYDEEE